MTEEQLAFVSIIIPVYNDSQRLRQCLSLLEYQTYPQTCYEVIVVDNNSTENLKPIVAQFSQAKYVFEAAPGSYCARNRGLAIAKGTILGFTDSDCAPASDWIAKGVTQIRTHSNCGFVAGRIAFSFQNPDNPTPAELYDSLHFLQQEKYVKDAHFGATANLFTTPQVFATVGSFNAALKSGGDREWGERVYAAGYPQIYGADVKISHPARTDFDALNTKLCRVYEGNFKKNNKATTPLLAFLREVFYDAKPPIRYLLGILKNNNIANLQKRIAIVYIYIRLRLSRAWVNLRLYFKIHQLTS
ncbi:glycosyltransferase family 2 protein [Leptolyngbya cf. ectocarpi LEGE 11479]|uniref:Glycosyltransferase family 2 protein n=1 Tax=Leptolyngbya cf. ectocarpi LEGE 11479 TaxID=1828722 RepID=A0A928WZN0_LEPEC|nr:glycosyltransferase family 2 protein [Leptolyngbya ectocarpi]MBE9066262.1 glycosyltransferase family 2 protein [Leptolyngbya cf. ectocarpi LEGE 11479]